MYLLHQVDLFAINFDSMTTKEEKESLSDELRRVTKDAHSISEQLVNVKLVASLTDKRLYGQALLLFCTRKT